MRIFFGHKFPVTDRHVAFHLFFMGALGDIDGAVIFAPKCLKIFFVGGKLNAYVFIGCGDSAILAVPERGFMPQRIVDDKRLCGKSPHEMRQNEFENIVIG